jgi:tetratricopeptide (TPR) repeat protein
VSERVYPAYTHPRVMRVFVSSTFHDMQGERDELVKRIFPQIRKLCEQRRVTWSEVDLRWGITGEQAAEGQVLPICLNEIQRCRPYFVGLLGERYGWVPDEIPAELLEQEPWLGQHLEHSITELEILHGVLNDPEMAEHAFFYFRDPAYTEYLPAGQQGAYREDPVPDEVERYGPEEAGRRAEGRKQKLQDLKHRIVASGFPVKAGYRDPVALGELVLRDMTAVIDRLFPQGSEPGPLDREALEHEAFAASRTRVYVRRQATLDRLDAHLQGDGPPLVVLGASGSGKSALLANWASQIRATHPQDGGPLPARPAAEPPAKPPAMPRGPGSGKTALMANWAGKVRDPHPQDGEPAPGVPAAMPAAMPAAVPPAVPPAVPAGPGSGKTALLAKLVSPVRAGHSHDLLLVHYIGATAHSADWAAMVRRIMGEFKRRLGIEGEIPGDPHELRAAFANWLHLAASRGRVVLVLDGLDRLEDRDAAPDLVWLPPEIPANVRLVLSTAPGRSLDELGKRGWPTLQVEPLELDERQRLIVEVLALYTKALSPARIERIAGAPQAANPLYLRALLEELRVFGLHEELDRRIDHYLAAATPQALYDKILERYEEDYERHRPGLVREAMQLLWAARRGLAEAELLDLLGADGDPLPGAYWSPLYLAAEAALASRSGLIGFFHDYLRQAVEERYLPSEEAQRAAHSRLADYFQSRALSARQADELPWQLAQAESWPRLYALLGALPFFAAAWKADPFEVKAFWAQIEANSPLRLVDAYKEAMEAPEQYAHHAWDLAILLHDTGHHDQALHLRRYLVEHHRQTGDTRSLPGALGNLAAILHELGDLDDALILLREEERLCRERDDVATLANTLGNQALILQDTGDLDGALALHEVEHRLCQELGNRDGVARSLGNQGMVATIRGDLDRALALFKEQERLCHELGNRDGMATALGNQGSVLLKRGDLDGAMALFEDQERICRDLGNKDGQAKALGNRGVILKMGGDLDGAMALTKRAERIFRDLGERDALAGTLGQQALILRARGDLDAAMTLFKEEERISRELSNKQELQGCLGNQALVLMDLGQLAAAMTLLKEQERICRDLDSQEGLQRSLGNQANILSDMGDREGAMALYREKERICRELGHPKGLAIALGNQAAVLAEQGRAGQALPLAEEAVRLASTHGLTRVAAQLLLTLQDIRSLAESPGQDRTELPSQPASAEAHYNLGVLYADQGRLDEAIGEFQAALRIQPDLAEAHHGLGLVYGRQGLVPEAMSEFQAALRHKPDYAEAHYNLGVLYAGQGRLDEAMGEWQAALRVEPDHVGARCNLGVAYGKQGRLDEAAREYKAALASKPDCAEAHYNLGVNYGTRGWHDQALREFQAAVRIKPDYVEAHNNLALAYWQGGRREEAIQQWKTAAQLGSTQARQVLAQLG